MARNFNGATDRIDYPSIQAVSGQAMTFSCQLYLDAITHSSYAFCVQTAATELWAVICWLRWISPNFEMAFTVNSGPQPNPFRTSTNNPFSTGSYVNLIWTWDGSLTAANIHMYIDGVEVGYQTTVDGTGAFTAADGAWVFGGRSIQDDRNIDGKLAECGWWNRVLNANERAMLAEGCSPRSILNGLKFAPDLTRHQRDPISGEVGTLDGTAVFPHPRIILPTRSPVVHRTWGIKLIAGTVNVQSAVSGTIVRFKSLAGTIACSSGTTGSLNKERRIVGSVAVTSSTTGLIKVTSKVTGTIAAESSIAGHLAGIWCIFGTSTAQSVVSGSIKATKKLSSTVAGQSSVTGSLRRTRKIIGTTVVTECATSGAIKVTSELLGTIAAESVISGNMTGGSMFLAATVTVGSSVTGSIKRTMSVSRTTLLRSTLAGHLATKEEMAGSISIVSTTSAVMKVTRKFVGEIAVQSTVNGFFVIEMTGTIAASSTVNGSVKVVCKLTATAPIVSSTAGVLTKNVSITGSITSQSITTGLIKITKEFIATISASSATVGSIKVVRKIVGVTIASSCAVTGALVTEVLCIGTVSIQSTVGGVVKISRRLTVVAACISTVSGSVKSTKKLTSVTITITSSVSGELAWPVAIPQFNIVSAINVLPIFAQDCRVNEELRRVSVTHGYTD